MFERLCFRTPLGTQCADLSKTLIKSNRQEFCTIVSFLWVKLRWNTCLLVTSETLGLFLNTLTADDTYSCDESEKLGHGIQMQLYKTRKIFYQFSVDFLESTSTFQHFEEKGSSSSLTISNDTDSERSCYLNFLKAMF